jgi:hypothetical protein
MKKKVLCRDGDGSIEFGPSGVFLVCGNDLLTKKSRIVDVVNSMNALM